MSLLNISKSRLKFSTQYFFSMPRGRLSRLGLAFFSQEKTTAASPKQIWAGAWKSSLHFLKQSLLWIASGQAPEQTRRCHIVYSIYIYIYIYIYTYISAGPLWATRLLEPRYRSCNLQPMPILQPYNPQPLSPCRL